VWVWKAKLPLSPNVMLSQIAIAEEAPWGHIKDSRQEQAVDQRVDQRMIRSPQSLAPTLKSE
jgi:hypothetical protein